MSTSQQADPLIGRLVDGRYRVRARIARGGMATVYLATDLRLERRVALKIMHAHLGDDAMFQSRFIQEARAAARLADPHVVNVFDQGQDAGLGYLVMEYLPGQTLREYIRDRRRLSIPEAIRIMDATLSGLAAAHRAGIVHRDVKPENVLIAQDGRIKIGDFGLARATSANTATGQMLLGTIAYLAPELVTRGTADARSDIYALGIMLYEMLTGEQPYKGEQPMQIAYQHATDSVPRPSVKNPGVPEQLDELVLWATEKEPADRPLDADVMLERLREIERELGVAPVVARAAAGSGTDFPEEDLATGDLTLALPAEPGTLPTASVQGEDNATRLRRRAKRRRTRGGWLVAIVVLLAGLAAGAGWWFGSGPGSLASVPDVAGRPYDDAAFLLSEASFVPVQGETYSLDVEPGLTVGTDPGTGNLLDRGTEVTVLISVGPRPQSIEALVGMPEDSAGGIVTGKNLLVRDPSALIFDDRPTGTVVGVELYARAAPESAVNCDGGCEAHEGDTIAFIVSTGPFPDVVGDPVDDAVAQLSGAGLEVSGDRPEEYSNDIPAGSVVRVGDRDGGGAWRPGDVVTLVVSRGPEPVEVPDVVGFTVADAMDTLREAGFEPGTALPELVWSIFTVSSTDPEGGSFELPGTPITVRSTG